MTRAPRDTTILRHVFLKILPIVIPVLICAFIIIYEFTYHTVEDEKRQSIRSELSYAQQTLENRFNVAQKWLENLSNNGMIINALIDTKGAGEYIPQLFKTLRVPGPQNGGHIILLDFQGYMIATNQTSSSLRLRSDTLDHILQARPYREISKSGLVLSTPILINNLPEGYLVAVFSPESLDQFLSVASNNNSISVIDSRKQILSAPSQQNQFRVGETFQITNPDAWVVSTQPLTQYPEISLISAHTRESAFQVVKEVKIAMLTFIATALGSIILSLSIAGKIVTRALSKMSQQMRRLRTERDLSKRVKISRIKELAQLETAYNEMAQDLQDTTVSKDYIGLLFNGLPLPVFVTDKDWKILETNGHNTCSLTTKDGTPPQYFQEIIANVNAREIDTSRLLLENPEKEQILYKSKGVTHPYLLSITPMKDRGGQLEGYIITATDIQEQKEREQEILKLAEHNKLLAQAMEEIELGITISDFNQPSQPLVFCNDAFLRISGRKRTEAIGHNCKFMQGPQTDPQTIQKISKAIAQNKAITTEIMNYRKDGEAFWNELSLNPIFTKDGVLRYYVGTQKDITDRKHVEAMKKEFISTVSHELRTPLTSIHGSLGLLNNLNFAPQDTQEKELLDIAYRNSERLKILIDDILDTEKLEAGEMRFTFKEHLLPEIITHSVELNKPYGEKYNVTFNVNDNIPKEKIYVDKDRIVQVFANLLSNAAKFSNGSKNVDIQVSRNKNDTIRISIKDYGTGIPKSFQKQIFGKFSQYDSSDNRKLPGTGLGLYITKRIIESHNGTISFETQKNQGTVFHVDLPQHKKSQEKRTSKNATQA